ncbi:MAG: DinB family protein, partial [Bacteroidetes bacterium]|nr:DinB family protein [Bacteroidota bacterium]
MSDYSDNLKKLVISFHDNFKEIEDLLASKHPAPGKWSSKEILGHLIDSAANNHRRFVQAAYQDDFVFDGYDQDKWVAVQRYNEVPWIFLLDLWKSYNLHLAR